MNKLIKENKKSFLIIAILLILIIIGFLVIYTFSPKKDDQILIEEEIDEYQAVLIPIEFLTSEELIDLGVDPNTRAQILSQDPLIYKVIRDDSDIIEDIAPYLEPIRE